MMKTIFGLVLLVAIFGQQPGHAATSEWFTTTGGKMRLITAARPDEQKIDAALEVLLKKGWKTYWRSPGESGIPPQFDFSMSSNVSSVTVKYPVPTYFTGIGGKTVGYKDRVVFPVEIKTTSTDVPTVLNMNLIIGVCGVVCIPVQANISVTEPGISSPSFEVTRTLNEASWSLPTMPKQDFRVVEAKFQENQPNMLAIESIVDENASVVDLHVEGPAGWYLLPAKLTSREGNKAQFLLDVTDIPDDAVLTETKLRFTLVADGRGIEQELLPVQ